MITPHWSLSVAAGPAAEPLAVADFKTHSRVVGTADDTYIAALILAARRHLERAYGVVCVCQTLVLRLDAFPSDDEAIILPALPARSVSSIAYTDSGDTVNTMAAADYEVDACSRPGRVVLACGASWPTATLRAGGAVTVQFLAGWGAAIASVDTTTETITLSSPYPTFAANDLVRAQNTGGALPTGLSTGTDYYVISPTGATLKLAATSGGSAINLTASGSGTSFIGEIPHTILQAIKLLAAHWYENREPLITTGAVPQELKYAIAALMGEEGILCF